MASHGEIVTANFHGLFRSFLGVTETKAGQSRRQARIRCSSARSQGATARRTITLSNPGQGPRREHQHRAFVRAFSTHDHRTAVNCKVHGTCWADDESLHPPDEKFWDTGPLGLCAWGATIQLCYKNLGPPKHTVNHRVTPLKHTPSTVDTYILDL